MKKIIFTSLFNLFILLVFSQGAVDAFRYSYYNHNGDARFMSMGGAFGALGGNISSLNYNPAGIGLYLRSDISATISYSKISNTTTYNSEMNTLSQNNNALTNIGIVIANENINSFVFGNWKNFQFGLSYSRLNDFNNSYLIAGPNTLNSIGDVFAAMAEGIHYLDIEDDVYENYAFDLNPAWYSYFFDTINGNPYSYVSLDPVVGGVQQSKLVRSWGYLDEVSITFGGNNADKFYLGASIGIPILSYHEISTYEEDALDPENPANNNSYYYALVKDDFDTKAYGFNMKLGMIYRVNGLFRLGVAFHSPTYFFNMKDNWETTMQSDFNSESNVSPLGYYEYNLTTPMKAIGSAAFILNHLGLISIDFEYVDYSTAKLSAVDYSFNSENRDIKDIYGAASNIRIGTEWKFMNISLRGGYSFYGSPYKNFGTIGEKKFYSLGLGYRDSNYYFDLAWIRVQTNDEQNLYGYDNILVNPALIKSIKNQLLMTFGIRF